MNILFGKLMKFVMDIDKLNLANFKGEVMEDDIHT